MDEKRKAAYRNLLYEMLLDLRMITPSGKTPLESLLKIRKRPELRRTMHYPHAYAQAFHNLAMFSAKDFQGFDEDRFWYWDIGYLERSCPKEGKYMRERFEKSLYENGTG